MSCSRCIKAISFCIPFLHRSKKKEKMRLRTSKQSKSAYSMREQVIKKVIIKKSFHSFTIVVNNYMLCFLFMYIQISFFLHDLSSSSKKLSKCEESYLKQQITIPLNTKLCMVHHNCFAEFSYIS